ncbi:hypothetical protein BJY04DRAFT_214076 [Aspergillus karnatakaensis]|uniref:uncharacterized protein n=1 Tax=Aspergillus karnatakaensis TaxID=1810916 RepID=UPI003CCD4B5F
MASDNNTFMLRAMDAIKDHVRSSHLVGDINPQYLAVMGPPNYRSTGANQSMWNAIFVNNLAHVQGLLAAGCKAMTPVPGNSCALDMAVRLGHLEIVKAFHQTPADILEIGLRTLLVAVESNDTKIVSAILDLGMRDILDNDEHMKCVLFGFTCKYGSPDMLDTICKYGPWFSWKAYKGWCSGLCQESQNTANKLRVAEIGVEYMEKEALKRPWENPNDILDTCGEDLKLDPLYEVMRYCTKMYPDLPIRNFVWDEYMSYKHPKESKDNTVTANIENLPRMGFF